MTTNNPYQAIYESVQKYIYLFIKKIIKKIKIHSSCEIEDFVETHLCKLYL